LRRSTLVVVLAGSLWFLLFDSGRPLPWLDESATMLAIQRPWSGVLALFGGADAPLVPYYLLAKYWAGMLSWLAPLEAVRGLSAVAAALTVACAYLLVSRYAGLLGGMVSALLLLSLPAFVRFAQEARPYALLSLAAAASWLAWSGWRRAAASRQGWGWQLVRATAYLVTLVAGPLVSLFAVFQWPAQLLAGLSQPGRSGRERVRGLAASGGLMIVAVLVTSYPVLMAATHGTGPEQALALDPLRIINLLGRAIIPDPDPGAGLLVLALALFGGTVGALRLWGRSSERELIGLCWWWLVVPMLSSLAVGIWRPGLLQTRYWQPALVPLVILAAIGLLATARAAFRLGGRRALGLALGVALVLAGLGAEAKLVKPTQVNIRTVGGHDGDLVGLLAVLDPLVAAYPDAPVLNSSARTGVALMSVRPGVAQGNPLLEVSQTSSSIWPTVRAASQLNTVGQQYHRFIWIVGRRDPAAPAPKAPPSMLHGQGFKVVSTDRSGQWFVMLVQR
jgi:mannosyltransferase